ncbi:hypothetical protein FACS18949_03000 [Clostridia bacterium]|nr:hypothetical protein FACS18949_03000 [Clostridia bacterium]
MIEVTQNERQAAQIKAIISNFPEKSKSLYGSIVRKAQNVVRQETIKGVTKTYAIDAAGVRANTNIKLKHRFEGNTVIGYIWFSGKRIPLHRYLSTPKMPTADVSKRIHAFVTDKGQTISHPGKAVHAKIERGDSMKAYDNKTFVAKMDSGHVGIFQRLSEVNKNIRELPGLSMPKMAENTIVLAEVERKAQEAMAGTNVDKIIHRFLNGG